MGELFDFEVGVVDAGGDEGTVEIANRREVMVVAGAAGAGNAEARLGGGGVLMEAGIDVVGDEVGAVGAELFVSVGFGLRGIGEGEQVHDVAGLSVERAQELGRFDREACSAAATD